jgi:hypothetical protein
MRWVVALGAAASIAFAGDARASVSLAVTWEGLVKESSAVAVVTAVDSHAAWENGRIFTYTHVHVDRAIAGELGAGADAWVRTMGGEVGDIGQRVEGEAVFEMGKPCLVFVQPGPAGSFHVTARAQGAFPVIVASEKDSGPRLGRGGPVGGLVTPQAARGATTHLAVEMLPGRLVDEVAHDVTADWGRLHAPAYP